MLKKLILGTVLGGLTVFAWGALSWMVLPWHEATLQSFADEQAVTAAIRANAPRPGIYVLPGHGHEDSEAASAAGERMKQGPVMFASVRLSGVDPEAPSLYLKGLLIEMAGALALSALLLTLPGLTYWGRVRTVTLVALIAGLVAHVPEWHWWGFSTAFTLTTILGLVIAWFLAGMVIAACVRSAGAPVAP